MNRHIHADKIIAKAENMYLVVLSRSNGSNWVEPYVDCHDSFSFIIECEYFLCLEEHKEACLHWLNGGEIEERGFYNDKGNFGRITIFGDGIWNPNHIFMSDKSEFRIKTKKEKRWIAYVKDMKRLGVLTFSNEAEAIAHYGDEADSFHQIEVEV